MEQLVIGDDVRREGVLVELLDCEGLRVRMSEGDIKVRIQRKRDKEALTEKRGERFQWYSNQCNKQLEAEFEEEAKTTDNPGNGIDLKYNEKELLGLINRRLIV